MRKTSSLFCLQCNQEIGINECKTSDTILLSQYYKNRKFSYNITYKLKCPKCKVPIVHKNALNKFYHHHPTLKGLIEHNSFRVEDKKIEEIKLNYHY